MTRAIKLASLPLSPIGVLGRGEGGGGRGGGGGGTGTTSDGGRQPYNATPTSSLASVNDIDLRNVRQSTLHSKHVKLVPVIDENFSNASSELFSNSNCKLVSGSTNQ